MPLGLITLAGLTLGTIRFTSLLCSGLISLPICGLYNQM